MHGNNDSADQLAHSCSLIRAFVICYLESRITKFAIYRFNFQGSYRLEKYLNLEGFLEKSLKIKFALKSAGQITLKS